MPLSPAQEGMFYETIPTPGSGIHVEQSIATLTGSLDVAAFERAWQWGVDRHAILRTGFVWKGQSEPLQVTLKHVSMALDFRDWRGISSVEQHQYVESYLSEERRRGFDLTHPPLMRLALFHLNEKIYRFVWTVHPI